MKKRGIISDKEELEQLVKGLARTCTHLSELKDMLSQAGVETYARGRQVLTGAWIGKKRFRLTTLGVSKEHFRMMGKEEERLRVLRRKRDQEQKKDNDHEKN